MNEKITFQQLSELLSSLTGGSQSTTELFLKELFAIISNALSNGEKVHLKGIGTFMPTIDNSNIEFAPDNELAESINLPFSCFEAIEIDDEIDFTETEKSQIESEVHHDSNSNDNEQEIQIQPKIIIGAENKVTTVTDNGFEFQDEIEAVTEDHDSAENFETEEIESNDDDLGNIETPQKDVDVDEIFPIQTAINHVSNTEDEIDNLPNKSRKLKFIWGLVIGLVIGFIIGISINYLPQVINLSSNNKIESEIIENTDSLVITQQNDTLNKIDHYAEPIAVDTVKMTRFLTTMARKYYNEMNYWVYIYEENKDKLGNPNQIKPGTIVNIPDIRKYVNSDSDSINVELAKLKAIEIYAPYQK